jgi:cytochrome c5
MGGSIMRNAVKLFACLTLMIFAATAVLAATGGNPKKGKYLYKKECKACHDAGGEGGKLTPLSKTQAQWDRFFEKDKHKAKPEAFKKFSDQDLKDIQQFLFDHAADSDQPETCG